ncbi:hypothetical protein FHR24_000890 [Wenyingzhuangia heitensis]|uniref:Transcriptional regulator, AbiEi antitoxin, Type IV TA system n=1 Tax=Wenyingzhuangia heitensis TaxID=1487859 RepID=A0ABX0UA57_9FLAO|nr:DUF6088 family protein [Wenyingzhuangia heitensis]NIJ44451.1 hypothetical protein [Wenyingzhuangia heitensis]
MKTTDYIVGTINKFPKGYVFTYEDFLPEVKSKEATIKSLNRMASSGKIAKLSKGKYYKPEQTVFGTLPPEQYQIVKDLLEVNNKTIGYLTGLSIYHQLGLTTQISNTIQIGKNEVRPAFQRDRYKIAFIRQKNTITKDSIPHLQLLDAIKYVKKIPDTTVAKACVRFMAILKEKSKEELKTIVRLSLKYPPSTRALLGALLQEIGAGTYLESLQNSLNQITKYKIEGVNQVVSSANNWNIE